MSVQPAPLGDPAPLSEREPARPGRALGRAIRRARAGRFTLAQLSGRAGVSIGLLSLIERGHGNPSINTLASIADALDISLPDLVAEAIDPGDESSRELVISLAPSTSSPVASTPAGEVTAPSEVVDDALTGWRTSMVLRSGQEARILVLDGTLELTLRSRTSPAEGLDRPPSIDLQLRTGVAQQPLAIPPADDPRWRDLALGEIPFEPSTLAGRMLFTHVLRCVRQDPSSPNLERWVRELRGFFVKYEAVSTAELAQVFGTD